MNTDLEEQEDELLALQSIFGSEEFVRSESKLAGEIRVSVDVPADFTVTLKEGEMLTQYGLSFLPPLLLTFELPENYPSSSPPSFTLTCSWLTLAQLSLLRAQLTELYQATGGAVVLFSWVQFLREDALGFLDIHNLLELPSGEHSTQSNRKDSQNAAATEPNNHHTPNSGPTDEFSEPGELDLSASSLEAQHPTVASDSWEAASLHQNNLTSHSSKVSQNDLHSDVSNDYDPIVHTSDESEAEQVTQSELMAEDHNVQSSAADSSKCLLVTQSEQTGSEDFLNEGAASASDLHSSSSSRPLDESGQGAAFLPVAPRESLHNRAQTLSGLSLTPAQILLSELLIYDASQKQKVFATSVFDCGVCFISRFGSECVQLPDCDHIFCQTCLVEFFTFQITEGNVRGVTCPQADCTGSPAPAQVKSLVGEELFSRYDRLLLQSTLDRMSDVVYCPRRSCGSAVILETSSTAALCPMCAFAFCAICRKTYHGAEDCQTQKIKKETGNFVHQVFADLPQSAEGLKSLWDDYNSGSKERRRLLESRYGHRKWKCIVEDGLSEDWMATNSKNCPHCFSRIQKDMGCDRMMCTQCRQQFCWACLAKLSGTAGHHVSCPAYY
ncbi:E3 ubiquitin-protein ligase RNF14-like [Mastacembelus armatus]|uniref:RBR-type E3 ubiquitin transferase n=1 Tax=Mastacembelus armatus TaxID=205130 RepID=A0A3Q3S6C2_9TELE|nr:E3 ubiquitin-protein ligase RNF14-like [Mastacembelus armatus]